MSTRSEGKERLFSLGDVPKGGQSSIGIFVTLREMQQLLGLVNGTGMPERVEAVHMVHGWIEGRARRMSRVGDLAGRQDRRAR